MITEAVKKIVRGLDLDRNEMYAAMQEIMGGEAETPHIVEFLAALEKKGVSVEELTAAAQVMRRYVTKIHTDKKIVLDTCGTGADAKGTFNISTACAFVASGCGITVAKHGNRCVSSRSGSADVLEALGVDIQSCKEKIEACLNDIGIAFLFAQGLHPAMKYAMPARKQIAGKTIFNLLGPLTNPASAAHQLIGVYGRCWTEILAGVLFNLGTTHALVVHGEDGLDEITTTAKTFISEVHKGKLSHYEINPQDFGIRKAKLEDLAGGSAQDNAKVLLELLKGKTGPVRDIVLLNSAAAVYAADKSGSIKEAIKLAGESIDSGRAMKKLELLKEYTHK